MQQQSSACFDAPAAMVRRFLLLATDDFVPGRVEGCGTFVCAAPAPLRSSPTVLWERTQPVDLAAEIRYICYPGSTSGSLDKFRPRYSIERHIGCGKSASADQDDGFLLIS
jgi:hypothetical protein